MIIILHAKYGKAMAFERLIINGDYQSLSKDKGFKKAHETDKFILVGCSESSRLSFAIFLETQKP